MGDYKNIIKDIKNKKLQPVYFLAGEEAYFIDRISKTIEDEVLTEDEKGFNQSVVYGKDVDIDQIIGLAKQFPMAAQKQVVIVKEAQHLSRSIENFTTYFENPQPSTVLVINYKKKKPDGRLKMMKTLSKNGWLYESPIVYDNQIPNFIDDFVKEAGLGIDTKSKFMLTEFLGTDLGRIQSEILKLKIIVKNGNITPEIIERNIGISKDYNNFELQKSIGSKDAATAFKIAKYFGENPKDNPLVVTNIVLYNFFAKLIVYHTLADKSSAASQLGVSPYFIKDYQQAAHNYPLKKATQIISLIREADVKSKGIGSTGRVTDSELLTELIFKIINI